MLAELRDDAIIFGGLATTEMSECGDAVVGGAAGQLNSDRSCGRDCSVRRPRRNSGRSTRRIASAGRPCSHSGGYAYYANHRRRQILCQVVDPQPFRPSNSFRPFVHGDLRAQSGQGNGRNAAAVARLSSPAPRRPPHVARLLSPAFCRPPFVARPTSPAPCRPPFVARRPSPAQPPFRFRAPFRYTVRETVPVHDKTLELAVTT